MRGEHRAHQDRIEQGLQLAPRHAGRAQPLGVGLALVAEHVVLGRQHDGRRQALEAGHLDR